MPRPGLSLDFGNSSVDDLPLLISTMLPPNDSLASLQTICLSLLELKHPSEVQRLYAACAEEGFFSLDLEKSQILRGHEKVLSLAKRYFSQPVETKLLDDVSNDAFGCVSSRAS